MVRVRMPNALRPRRPSCSNSSVVANRSCCICSYVQRRVRTSNWCRVYLVLLSNLVWIAVSCSRYDMIVHLYDVIAIERAGLPNRSVILDMG